MTSDNWISVDERLPELKEIYSGSPKQWTGLICNIHGHIGEGSLKETFVKRVPSWKNASDRAVVVTHWREFPAPPVATPRGGE